MTHKDIFTKFMIEYDKANVTSSYPSLTEYEIATFLDKAYLTLIAQKVTGNNARRAPFEADVKSIGDIQSLVTSKLMFLGASGTLTKANNLWPKTEDGITEVRTMPDNMRSVNIPEDMLYFVAASVPIDMHETAGWQNDTTYDASNVIKPMDNKDSDYEEKSYKRYRLANAVLASHQTAKNFYASASNIPWIKNPICFFENNKMFLLLDPCIGTPELSYVDPKDGMIKNGEWAQLSYIKQPRKFAKDLDAIKSALSLQPRSESPEYSTSDSYELSFIVDEFLGADKGKIHLNSILIANNTHYSSETSSEKKVSTYFVEYSTSIGDPTLLAASQFEEGAYIFGKAVERCSTDDSFKLNPGNSVAFIRKDPVVGTNYTCSPIFVITYEQVYNLIKSQIDQSRINQDQSISASFTTGDDYYTGGTLIVQHIDMTTIIPIDSDASEYDGDYTDAYENVNMWSYSEYKLADTSIHSGSLLIDKYGNTLDDYYTFELNDVCSEELITLAITYALENVESSRLNAHLGIRGLES